MINLSNEIQNKIRYLSKWYQAKQDLQQGMSYKQPDTHREVLYLRLNIYDAGSGFRLSLK